MNRTLVVTNDFPPRQGGIQTFVAALLDRRPPDSLVVCVSRLVPRKGQDVLVAAWPRVLARSPRARLLLVGGGPASSDWSGPRTGTRPAGWRCPGPGR